MAPGAPQLIGCDAVTLTPEIVTVFDEPKFLLSYVAELTAPALIWSFPMAPEEYTADRDDVLVTVVVPSYCLVVEPPTVKLSGAVIEYKTPLPVPLTAVPRVALYCLKS